MSTKELWIATGNNGKLNEFKLALRGVEEIEIHSQNELNTFSSPPENGNTFLDNARIKARALRSIKNQHWILADDSGLEVEGLNGLPGVHSARYAGPKASDSENIAKLLKMMSIRSIANRKARFVCTLVVFNPQGEEWIFEGELRGRIGLKPQGLHGFGYDPVFFPEGQEQTLAELGAAFKVQHSHRALATNQFITKLKANL